MTKPEVLDAFDAGSRPQAVIAHLHGGVESAHSRIDDLEKQLQQPSGSQSRIDGLEKRLGELEQLQQPSGSQSRIDGLEKRLGELEQLQQHQLSQATNTPEE